MFLMGFLEEQYSGHRFPSQLHLQVAEFSDILLPKRRMSGSSGKVCWHCLTNERPLRSLSTWGLHVHGEIQVRLQCNVKELHFQWLDELMVFVFCFQEFMQSPPGQTSQRSSSSHWVALEII